MKHKVELIILLLFGLAFLVYLFPFVFVEAAKLESGVTINAPTTTENEKICDDTIDNDKDGKIDAADEDCTATPAGPAAGTCGLHILSGVPIKYGQVAYGQDSAEQKVTIKNVGTATATISVKGGGWFAHVGAPPEMGALGEEAPVLGGTVFLSSEPGDTHVATTPNLDYNNKKPLSGSGLKLDQISGGQSIPIYFQLRVPTAWYTQFGYQEAFVQQEVSIDLLCRATELLKEDEARSDYITSAKTPSAPSPLPIPYPDTNNSTGMQDRAD